MCVGVVCRWVGRWVCRGSQGLFGLGLHFMHFTMGDLPIEYVLDRAIIYI